MCEKENKRSVYFRRGALYFSTVVYTFYSSTEANLTPLMRVERRLQAVIDQLHYDFTAFDIQHFINHLQLHRQRPIHVIDFRFSPEIFGLWVPAKGADYIFVNQTLLPFHRVHTLLHELAHMLLNHRGVDLRKVLDEKVWSLLGIEPSEGHLRATVPSDTAQDEEAEWFVILIQRQVTHANRLRELYGETTSLASMRQFVDGLDLNS